MLAADLDSVFLMGQAFGPGMRARGAGRVVDQTSATFGMAVLNATHSVAAKMGVVASDDAAFVPGQVLVIDGGMVRV
jgi:NAD(P)-dependent dehydrogenase (short-subunit alcohol dehydrogenase family)